MSAVSRSVLLIAAISLIAPFARAQPQASGAAASKQIPEIILAVRQQDHPRIATLLAGGSNPTVLSPTSEGKPGPSAWVWAVLLQDNRSLNLLLENVRALDKAPMAGHGFL